MRAFREAFRSPLPRTTPGRPKLRAWDTIAIVQGVNQPTQAGLAIQRRHVQGRAELVQHLLDPTQSGGQITTAYSERLNGTFRQGLAALTRRRRSLARLPQTLTHGMFLVGTVYNVCSYQDSLAVERLIAPHRRPWLRRTPAIAAGLTDQRWSVLDLRTFKTAPPPVVPLNRHGRPPKPRTCL